MTQKVRCDTKWVRLVSEIKGAPTILLTLTFKGQLEKKRIKNAITNSVVPSPKQQQQRKKTNKQTKNKTKK